MDKAPYSFQTARRILAGPGTTDSLGKLAADLGARKAAIVTDPGIVKRGLIEGPKRSMKDAGIDVDVVSRVIPEPPIELIEDLHTEMAGGGFDFLVGIGGGSSLDVAKIMSVRLTSGQPVRDFMGTELVQKPGLPMALIPTTAGTGSEVTPNAIVTLTKEKLKVGIVSRFFLPDLVILDPKNTVSMPKHVTAATGMDAFIHSLESFIAKKKNPFSDTFALRSMRLISKSIRRAFHFGDDLCAREDMLVGSMLGGMALTASGTAAVHALAYPLGGSFNIPHGVANSMLLLPVMECNFDAVVDELAAVSEAMSLNPTGSKVGDAKAVMDELWELVEELEIPKSLRGYGVTDSDVPALAEAASRVTRLLGNNPIPLSLEVMQGIYRKIL